MCDNTDCEGKSKEYFNCKLTSDFDNEHCIWCKDCMRRDDDMVESYSIVEDKHDN